MFASQSELLEGAGDWLDVEGKFISKKRKISVNSDVREKGSVEVDEGNGTSVMWTKLKNK